MLYAEIESIFRYFCYKSFNAGRCTREDGIAAAVVAECNCIISWNFKHTVNIKTIHGVRAITNLTGYKPIAILSPAVLLESEE